MEPTPRRTPSDPRRPASTLDAVAVSTAVLPLLGAPDPAAEVVSVHRGAVNLRVRGQLIGLVEAGAGALPNAILIAPPGPSWTACLRAGLRVEVGAGGLVLGGDRLVVRLTGARVWSPRLGVLGIEPGVEERLAAARAALDAATGGGVSGGAREEPVAVERWRDGSGFAEELFVAAAATSVAALQEALRTGDEARATTAGLALVGLGHGLTPAGDDLLIGVSAALTAMGHPAARTLAGSWATHAVAATTPLAASFHHHAAEAEYAESLHLLLNAVLAGSTTGTIAAVERAAAWGATSGRDLVAGVLLGLGAASEAGRIRVSNGPHPAAVT